MVSEHFERALADGDGQQGLAAIFKLMSPRERLKKEFSSTKAARARLAAVRLLADGVEEIQNVRKIEIMVQKTDHH